MRMKPINAPDAPQPVGGYAQAMEVTGAERILFVSGQIPTGPDGSVPESSEDQARLAHEQSLTERAKANFIVGDVDAGEDDLLRAAVDLSCHGIADSLEG